MKRVLLIYGDPGSGKTNLAKALRDHYSFHRISGDRTYSEFVRTRCPKLYFEWLNFYAAPHYESILNRRQYSMLHFGRDFVAEWQSHLMARVAEASALHDDLVVDGYLLKYVLNELEANTRSVAQVYLIHAVNRTYELLGSPMAIDEIARLGRPERETPE